VTMMRALDKCLENKCCRVTLQILKWIPVIFVATITSWAYYTFVYELCIVIIKELIQRVAYLILFHVLLSLFLWSYIQVVFTRVAKPPAEFYLPLSLLEELSVVDNDYDYRLALSTYATGKGLRLFTRGFDNGVRFCVKCSCIKPDRAHHCSACGCCVLKFDHHCPWVNNCIGFSNYKHFILFLGYGFYLCVFGFFSILPFSLKLTKSTFHRDNEATFGDFQVFLLFFASVLFGVSLGCLLLYHLCLIARNRTTLETFRSPVFVYGADKSGYDVGLKRNYQQVFGSNCFFWFIPMCTGPGDGCDFPHKSAYLEETGVSHYAD